MTSQKLLLSKCFSYSTACCLLLNSYSTTFDFVIQQNPRIIARGSESILLSLCPKWSTNNLLSKVSIFGTFILKNADVFVKYHPHLADHKVFGLDVDISENLIVLTSQLFYINVEPEIQSLQSRDDWD